MTLDALFDPRSLFALSLPIIFSGVGHMAIVKARFMEFLARPVSSRLFGRNKTWRGFLVIPVLSIPGVWLSLKFVTGARYSYDGLDVLLVGCGLGLSYALAELPNSFLKRRLGIPEGQAGRWSLVLLDQADSVIGCALFMAIFIKAPFAFWLSMIICGAAVHMAVNLLLYSIKLRKQPL